MCYCAYLSVLIKSGVKGVSYLKSTAEVARRLKGLAPTSDCNQTLPGSSQGADAFYTARTSQAVDSSTIYSTIEQGRSGKLTTKWDVLLIPKSSCLPLLLFLVQGVLIVYLPTALNSDKEK